VDIYIYIYIYIIPEGERCCGGEEVHPNKRAFMSVCVYVRYYVCIFIYLFIAGEYRRAKGVALTSNPNPTRVYRSWRRWRGTMLGLTLEEKGRARNDGTLNSQVDPTSTLLALTTRVTLNLKVPCSN